MTNIVWTGGTFSKKHEYEYEKHLMIREWTLG